MFGKIFEIIKNIILDNTTPNIEIDVESGRQGKSVFVAVADC